MTGSRSADPLSEPANGLRRREFLTFLGAALVAPLFWPHAANAQQPGKVQTIGFLGTTTPTIWSANVAAFLERLRELGWIDGRNIAIEYRWTGGRDDRYAELAAELAQRKVDIIVTAGTTAVLAVKKRNNHDSDRVCRGRRPGPYRFGVKPGAAWQQCHRPVQPADRSWRPQTSSC